MKLSLLGRVVMVTGASRGIGAASAVAMGAHGASVVVNYSRSRESAEEVLAEIRRLGGDGMVYGADVRDVDAVNAMVDAAVSKYGKVDVLLNNAAIGFPVKPFVELSWDEVHAKVSGEIHALHNCAQAVLRDMVLRKSGKLVFVSSSLSRQPGAGFAAHAAAKSAVDAMAKVMALELGPLGITVNVIAPGLVKTDATAQQPAEMFEQIAASTPLRRVGMPNDVAGVTVFLASELSDYVTGQYFLVNGGSYMV